MTRTALRNARRAGAAVLCATAVVGLAGPAQAADYGATVTSVFGTGEQYGRVSFGDSQNRLCAKAFSKEGSRSLVFRMVPANSDGRTFSVTDRVGGSASCLSYGSLPEGKRYFAQATYILTNGNSYTQYLRPKRFSS